MKKNITAMLAAIVSVVSISGHAEKSIFESLKNQGAQFAPINDQELGEIKGAARIIGQSMPSVTQGIKTYEITWSKFGAIDDYRSYRMAGFSYDPHRETGFSENGTIYQVAGDRWLADRVSNANSWDAAYAVPVDLHYQAIDENTGQPMKFGWRTTSWNRPISTFRW
ncbi:hypothetical protein [Pseudomonas sp. LP_7_YM]|uniref:hypothetical protein n=1 Tax=Pseudomonas sp. LP_7_YM TaxID=2485137 RepID=UPI0010DAF9BD|nr:hypothetical protein [Pseudomonas sp. LP_7_YM]TDV58491.1 hypothetical protein EC915_1422 [Pseudomonas sp. LP_7_YM]